MIFSAEAQLFILGAELCVYYRNISSEIVIVMEDKLVTVIPVIGMTCQNCVNKIESTVAKISSVVLVKVIMRLISCTVFYVLYMC